MKNDTKYMLNSSDNSDTYRSSNLSEYIEQRGSDGNTYYHIQTINHFVTAIILYSLNDKETDYEHIKISLVLSDLNIKGISGSLSPLSECIYDFINKNTRNGRPRIQLQPLRHNYSYYTNIGFVNSPYGHLQFNFNSNAYTTWKGHSNNNSNESTHTGVNLSKPKNGSKNRMDHTVIINNNIHGHILYNDSLKLFEDSFNKFKNLPSNV